MFTPSNNLDPIQTLSNRLHKERNLCFPPRPPTTLFHTTLPQYRKLVAIHRPRNSQSNGPILLPGPRFGK